MLHADGEVVKGTRWEARQMQGDGSDRASTRSTHFIPSQQELGAALRIGRVEHAVGAGGATAHLRSIEGCHGAQAGRSVVTGRRVAKEVQGTELDRERVVLEDSGLQRGPLERGGGTGLHHDGACAAADAAGGGGDRGAARLE